jgi:hypothetical protein
MKWERLPDDVGYRLDLSNEEMRKLSEAAREAGKMWKYYITLSNKYKINLFDIWENDVGFIHFIESIPKHPEGCRGEFVWEHSISIMLDKRKEEESEANGQRQVLD